MKFPRVPPRLRNARQWEHADLRAMPDILRANIQRYWLGHPSVVVYEETVESRGREVKLVRSNLINGLPPEMYHRIKAAK